MAGALKVNVTVVAKAEKYRAPALTLKPGWNTVRADLRGTWLTPQARRAAEQVEWSFSASNPKLAGWVVFDNFRAGARQQ
jgi:hypothetical protein